MYSLVIILMVLVCINFILKQSWHKWWSVLAHAAAAALFTGLMWPAAVRQSRSQIDAWLSDPGLMLDTSVVITIEVILQISFCLLSVNLMNSGKLKPSVIWSYRVLRWFPGILIFGVLFSFLVCLIFAFPGMPFTLVAWSAAAVVFAVTAGGAWLIRLVFPDRESRLEIFFQNAVYDFGGGSVFGSYGQCCVKILFVDKYSAQGFIGYRKICHLRFGLSIFQSVPPLK